LNWKEISLYQEEHEVVKENYIPHEPFDREKETQQFYKRFTYNQEHIKSILPEQILEKIADIRVFALDKASKEVIDSVTKFCNDNEKLAKKASKDYETYCKKVFKYFDRNIVENINFHDCTIIDVKEGERSLSILFDNSCGGLFHMND